MIPKTAFLSEILRSQFAAQKRSTIKPNLKQMILAGLESHCSTEAYLKAEGGICFPISFTDAFMKT